MSFTVEERKRVRRAARAIRDEVATESVDVLAPSASQYDEWTLDAVLRNSEGIPPEILRELALAGLTLQPTPSQAEYQHVAATV
ncbi:MULTISPECIES: hypothetical protein [unclassified Haloarcula]|uniref:hypothetical protein n=1 Tax=unclassified Haloarcula TaxID=2624677 RepID=UPI000EF175CF|nr:MULTISPECIES: hypothetical protein [unclassified Haloarcula]RLM34406.1 hypothetical protein DVK01_11880 [Haloarcula sp. Atlit-120R]RLM89988.1 hypothetical protein D3D01_17960 [Haloarcula sp. Atlit-7R]